MHTFERERRRERDVGDERGRSQLIWGDVIFFFASVGVPVEGWGGGGEELGVEGKRRAWRGAVRKATLAHIRGEKEKERKREKSPVIHKCYNLPAVAMQGNAS